MKSQSDQLTLKVLVENLMDSFHRWDHLYREGCNDPTYTDGMNLALVRNHIIWYKEKIKELVGDGELPKEYYYPTPREVDREYMAQPDKIRESAEQLIADIKASEGYKYLTWAQNALSVSEQQELKLGLLKRVRFMENALRDNHLVYLRMAVSSGDEFKKTIDEMAENTRVVIANPKQDVQLSLFA